MIRIFQIKLPVSHDKQALEEKIRKKLRLRNNENIEWSISKKAIDARKKPVLYYVYNVDIYGENEKSIIRRAAGRNIQYYPPEVKCCQNYRLRKGSRPVIVGSGPGGLFCGYVLARAGLNPLIIEQGEPVGQRRKTVEKFWEKGVLNLCSNVQFGEGGAGTFSDGKLSTQVNDKTGRNRMVLDIFASHGAPRDILYESRPHIGTDMLSHVVQSMREEICRMGGSYLFETKFFDFVTTQEGIDKKVAGAKFLDMKSGIENQIDTDTLVLAMGHSARETFQTLYERDIAMRAKAFAVGVRIQHPQEMIDISQYGIPANRTLPAASYKLTTSTPEGIGVYSFCMCPGGFVVDASSEGNMLAVNGMSYQDRSGANANSAIIVTVSPQTYGDGHALSGILFQQELEKRAFAACHGKIPLQTLGDFINNTSSDRAKTFSPQIKGRYDWSNLRDILPEMIVAPLIYGISNFDSKVKGFARSDAILAAVESRTSSPLCIERDKSLQSNVKGLFPCGEGAGYAGGIMSSAMDGIRIAQMIIQNRSIIDC